MFGKKIISILISSILVVTLFAGCSSSSSKSASSDKGNEKVVLRLGHVASTNDPWHLASTKFAEIVKEKSNGRIEVQVFSDGQIGQEPDMAEGLQMGTVDMAILGVGTISKLYPALNVLALPYIFRDRDHLLKVLNGDIGAKLLDDTNKATGIKGLAYWERGPRALTNSKRPINSPADVKGLKLRTPGEELPMDIWKAMGAGATPMAFGELFTALQQGVVDGQENPLSIIESSKFSEVQPYLALTNHTWAPAVIAISDKKFTSLSAEDQKILTDAAAESASYESELVQKQEVDLLAKLKAEGMKVTTPDLSAFAEATKDVHLKYDSMYGKDLYDQIKNVK